MTKNYIVKSSFVFNGRLWKAGSVIVVSGDDLQAEKSKGSHEKTGKPISGLLNHCYAEDEEEDAKEVEPTSEMLEAVRDEFQKIGAAFDRRWKLDRLKNELIKAKKERGL